MDAYIIDGNLITLFATQYTLERHREIDRAIAFQTVESALKALTNDKEAFSASRDIVFLELRLNGIDGWEFLKKFEALSNPKRRIHFFLLIDHANKTEREKALAHPLVKSIILKPLTSIIIDRIVECTLGH